MPRILMDDVSYAELKRLAAEDWGGRMPLTRMLQIIMRDYARNRAIAVMEEHKRLGISEPAPATKPVKPTKEPKPGTATFKLPQHEGVYLCLHDLPVPYSSPEQPRAQPWAFNGDKIAWNLEPVPLMPDEDNRTTAQLKEWNDTWERVHDSDPLWSNAMKLSRATMVWKDEWKSVNDCIQWLIARYGIIKEAHKQNILPTYKELQDAGFRP